MVPALDDVLRERLVAADRRFGQGTVAWGSLAPARARAHTLEEIADAVLMPEDDPALMTAFVGGLTDFAEAIRTAFPGNLFWDLDLPAASWLALARGGERPAARCAELFGLAVELQRVFGHPGPLHFRYAHDFNYGYDWVKWVGRAPLERAAMGPFDPMFLRAMSARGRELAVLVARGDDRDYPPLPDDVARNPFPFSREPECEWALHRELARLDQLPLRAWRTNDSPRWDRPWAAWREAAAARLGIGSAAAGGRP